MADDLHHIERVPLPWRHGDRMTECGRPIPENTWTRQEAVAQCKKLGKQRFAFAVCMTCMRTAGRHTYNDGEVDGGTWEADPVHIIAREAERVDWRRDLDGRRLLGAELKGLAALVEAHPEEFADFVDGLLETPDLTSKRRAKNEAGRYLGVR